VHRRQRPGSHSFWRWDADDRDPAAAEEPDDELLLSIID
jgi:hypothetical protein